MKMITENLVELANIFYNAGYTLYVVGGAVRNSLMGLKTDDIDICSAATLDIVAELLKNSGFALKFRSGGLGTAVIAKDNQAYEYTAFRRESYRGGQHRPSSVEFTDDINLDMLRRDFTVNSMYYDIVGKKLVDNCNGQNHLKQKLIAATDTAERVFAADGLRILRMVRFAAELNFSVDQNTFVAAKQSIDNISDLTPERVTDEMLKILCADSKYSVSGDDAVYNALNMLLKLGAFKYILPELEYGENIKQNKHYHKYNVTEHIFRTVQHAPTHLRLAALLHDIGKPQAQHAYGRMDKHNVMGVETAKRLFADKIKICNKDQNRILRLIEHHDYDLRCDVATNKVKVFIVDNLDLFDDLLELKTADQKAKGFDKACDTVERWKNIYAEMLATNTPLKIKDLKMQPMDVLKEFENFDKTKLSKAMRAMLVHCIENPNENDKDKLTAFFKNHFARMH